jgi:heme-degrading monooxygenase HmoA
MSIQVFLRRKIRKDLAPTIMPLIAHLRQLALEQPGYISGDTLLSDDNPEDVVVISKWNSIDDWNSWNQSSERASVQKEIDELLGEPTIYEIFNKP